MTTVAYHFRHGIAADSRITERRVIVGAARKIGRAGAGRYLWGAAGRLSFITDFADWITRAKSDHIEDPRALVEEMPRVTKDSCALVVDRLTPRRLIVIDRYAADIMEADYFAIGSGRDFALGALADGADAKRAVKAAARHCTFTGAPVVGLGWD